MGFFRVNRSGLFWEPKLSEQPQPWYQRALCYFLGHDWIAKEWAKTGYAVLNPGFRPTHEMARLCTCNRCHKKTWIGGQLWGPHLDRYNREYHADEYPFDEKGWPLTKDGFRLPIADKPNCTGF